MRVVYCESCFNINVKNTISYTFDFISHICNVLSHNLTFNILQYDHFDNTFYGCTLFDSISVILGNIW